MPLARNGIYYRPPIARCRSSRLIPDTARRALLDNGLLTGITRNSCRNTNLPWAASPAINALMGLNLGHHFAQTDGRT